jgi:DNA replication and repair protein RecF
MRVTRLSISGVRCLQQVELAACAGVNLLLGGNGAGKTSVLEGLYLLGSGKSFRFGGFDALIAHGARQLQVYAELEHVTGVDRVGFERSRSGWRALRNGDRVNELAELATLVPVVCFSPESHGLIAGGSEVRRRFFDWIVFHVEPEFKDAYRRYARLLTQRNALLKQSPDPVQLSTWTRQLADAGEVLAELRERVFPEFASAIGATLGELLGEMGSNRVSYRRGWRDGMSLLERLQMLESRELALGYSLAGPHRGDWLVEFDGHEVREHGSRGQQKLVALASVMAAARLYRDRRGHPPIVALDDLASELDIEHQRRALVECSALGAQLWITGTHRPAAFAEWSGEIRTFHVEHGRVATRG